MTILQINLFGSINIKLRGNKKSGLKTKKVKALLAFLVVEINQSHNRNSLAELFWPEKPDGTARNSLKQAISNLKLSLGDNGSDSPFLLIDRNEIQINSGSDLWVDCLEFEKLIKETHAHSHSKIENCQKCIARLLEAKDLYRGDFCKSFSIPDSGVFEEWIVTKREAYQRMMTDVLRNLISHDKQLGDSTKACQNAEQLVSLEPWNEENHRLLLVLFAEIGERSQALKQYKKCINILDKELGVEPSEETVKIYEKIRDGQYHEPKELVKEKSRTIKEPKLKPYISAFVFLLILCVLGTINIFSNPKTNSGGISSKVPDSTSADQKISEKEIEILKIIYDEMGGVEWKNNDHWLEIDQPCTWYGVVCEGNSVYEINLADNHLSGKIPSEIGELVNLNSLVLSGNRRIEGPIPPKMGNLINLKYLVLSTYEGGTQLSGSIPVEFGNLGKLQWLEIENSLVSGTIPSELGRLTNLKGLFIGSNSITGIIPPELGELVNLEILSLGEGKNELTGPLPMSLINLKKLQAIHFGDSNLCIPNNERFLNWLGNIDYVYGTDVICP